MSLLDELNALWRVMETEYLVVTEGAEPTLGATEGVRGEPPGPYRWKRWVSFGRGGADYMPRRCSECDHENLREINSALSLTSRYGT